MHEKVLPRGSGRLLDQLEKAGDDRLNGWILAGGTGLALQLGHRVSEDFDFFRTDEGDCRVLHEPLRAVTSYETLQEEPHTLTVLAQGGIKCSFFRVRDRFLSEAVPYRFFRVAALRDIALMKIAAIAGRGSRRDFVDLYTILRGGVQLRELLDLMPRKYGAERINAYHLLKSLAWFDDAEQEPMPRMLEPFNWKECKAFFLREARALLLR
jgi:predicted nucleotidyltransferase component of viral defense system